MIELHSIFPLSKNERYKNIIFSFHQSESRKTTHAILKKTFLFFSFPYQKKKKLFKKKLHSKLMNENNF